MSDLPHTSADYGDACAGVGETCAALELSSSANGTSCSVNGVSSSANGASSPAKGTSCPANGASCPANGVSSSANGASSPVKGTSCSANGVSRATQAEDERWMRRCLQLARQGELTTAPNPMVGAVIVHGTGEEARILGEGYHVRPGEGHAEVHAFRSVRPEDRPLLSESTIYVTLEPCAHYGRTPPCSALIIKNGVKRCVIGSEDPFRKVSGRGITMLQEAGVDVTVGVLRKECIYLNRKFFCQNVLRRPFITLKWAATSDGFIDRSRSLDENGEVSAAPLRLSSPSSLLRVHHFRATHQAILVGRKTFQLDAPQLNVRCWPGASPLRCVLGSVDERALSAGFQAYADIDSLLEGLRRDGVQSLFVEGGQATLQSFIERDLWDEAWEEVCPQRIGEGVPAPSMPRAFTPQVEEHFGRTYRHWISPVLAKNYVDF